MPSQLTQPRAEHHWTGAQGYAGDRRDLENEPPAARRGKYAKTCSRALRESAAPKFAAKCQKAGIAKSLSMANRRSKKPKKNGQKPKVHPNLEFILPLVLFREAYGRAPTEDDLIALLKRLPRNLFLSLLTALNCVACYRVNLTSKDGQLKLLGLLGYERNSEVFYGIRSRLESEHVAFISIAGLAALAACASVYGDESGDKWPDHPQPLVLDALLMVNEFVHEYRDQPTIDDLAISEVRSLTENPEPLQDALYRYSLLINWKPTDTRTPALPRQLAEEFRDLIGLGYEDYATAALATMAWILDLSRKNLQKQTLETLNIDIWLQHLNEKELIFTFIRDNSMSIKTLRKLIGDGSLNDVVRNWRKAFLPRPMLQITEKDFLIPFPFGAAGALGKGLLFRLVSGYNFKYNRPTGDLFLNYYGRFLEDYIDSVLRKSLRGNNARILRDVPYTNAESSDNRFVDNIVFEGSSAAFLEVTAKRFRLVETVINGNVNALKEDLEEMIFSKAEQLAESIALFKDDKLPGEPANKVKNIFPIIVVDEFTHIAALNKIVRDGLIARGLALPNLQIIKVNELEMLETALSKGRALTSILKAKCKHSETADMSMKNYAIRKEPALLQGRLSEVVAASQAWYQMTYARIKDWGLGEQSSRQSGL